MDANHHQLIESLADMASREWAAPFVLRFVTTATNSEAAKAIVAEQEELDERDIELGDEWFQSDDPRIEARVQWGEEFVWIGVGPSALS